MTQEPQQNSPVDEAEVKEIALKVRESIESHVSDDFSIPAVRRAAVDALEGQVLLIQEAMARTLQKGVHYGTIPGTARPSLWQPGAEMLCQMFGFKTYVEQTNAHEDWDKGLFAYQFKCTLKTKNDEHITERYATCSTRERQYQRQIKDYGQDPAELRETLMLMAQKRAYVAAVRSAGACSAVFTQDDDIVQNQVGNQQPTTVTVASAPSNAPAKSGLSIPCQMGHAGHFWTAGKYAPAHSATPRWCSMAHWIKQLFDEHDAAWMAQFTQGIGLRYSKWDDAAYETFWKNYQKKMAEGEVESVEEDLPWDIDEPSTTTWEDEQLNF